MTTHEKTQGILQKPVKLRAIFFLYVFKLLFATALLVAFQFFGLTVDGVTTQQILYTTLGYLVLFAGIVMSIMKQNLIALRTLIVIDFLITIPTRGPVGFLVDIIAFALTFTAPVKKYFAN